MEKSYIKLKPSDNYIIIKQNLDEGLIGGILLLSIVFSILYIVIKNTTH